MKLQIGLSFASALLLTATCALAASPVPTASLSAGNIKAPYPVKLTCPTGIALAVPDKLVPAGWSATGLPVKLLSVQIPGSFMGKQELDCGYVAALPPATPELTFVRHFVEPDSCIVGPDAVWFQCKLGTK